MAKIKDRTRVYKETVHDVALSLGYNESQMAAISASLILPRPCEKSPFIKAALKTLESIAELERFIVKHRKDYVDLHRTIEQERDSIEHEVSVFIKTCKDQIDCLRNSIYNENNKVKSRKWLSIQEDNSHADIIAHRHGVVLILSERLHAVTAQFDQLRAIRFQDAVNRAMPRRLRNKVPDSNLSHSFRPEVSELEEKELQPEPLRIKQQILDDETQTLQVELSSLLDAVQETETKMVEMSALNHLMSTHVLQQAQQIEHLYEQAVEATNNVERGNTELSKAIERNSSSRTFLLLVLLVLPLALLFLDWYQ
ncbi:syntaxin-81 [Amborella trichopoda]|nr:syntaxin-81 [Amborella trichopoda]|eukprot:XP_011628097.1 syntaxin-81 [Amborella trichopoda]